jgi:N-acetylmuramoyl-L-alanine amidase
MHKNIRWSWLIAALLFFSTHLCAETAQLKALSLATASQSTRLLFDLSTPAQASVSQSHNRLTVRLADTSLAVGLRQPPANQAFIGKIKAQRAKDGLVVLVDLKAPVTHRFFRDQNGSRLVVELNGIKPPMPGSGNDASKKKPEYVANRTEQGRNVGLRDSGRRTMRGASAGSKELVIAIDAGHGGKDTGAIGPNGTREKDVVFAIARKLEAMIRAERGMRPVMVRKADEFIELRERAEIARQAKADLFISLHADAYVNGEAKGSSVFTLSTHGATSEAARWLADHENSADLVGGVKLSDKDKLLASVLLDLSQTATIADSDRAASQILSALKKNHQLHHHEVQKAGFVVLKSPDIPSLLIETAFISNPDEEKNLASKQHQEVVARSIFDGIRSYCANRPSSPVRRTMASANSGDSTVVIAQH